MPEDIFYFKESEIPTELPDIPQEVFAPIREGLIAGTLVEIEYESASEEDRMKSPRYDNPDAGLVRSAAGAESRPRPRFLFSRSVLRFFDGAPCTERRNSFRK